MACYKLGFEEQNGQFYSELITTQLRDFKFIVIVIATVCIVLLSAFKKIQKFNFHWFKRHRNPLKNIIYKYCIELNKIRKNKKTWGSLQVVFTLLNKMFVQIFVLLNNLMCDAVVFYVQESICIN